jgi:hypothetical protein
MQKSFREKNFAKLGIHARRTKQFMMMDGEKYEKAMNVDTICTRPGSRVCVREFSVYVKLRNDICYLLKFKEDVKGQDVMDEVKNIRFLERGFKVHFVF